MRIRTPAAFSLCLYFVPPRGQYLLNRRLWRLAQVRRDVVRDLLEFGRAQGNALAKGGPGAARVGMIAVGGVRAVENAIEPDLANAIGDPLRELRRVRDQ